MELDFLVHCQNFQVFHLRNKSYKS
jgi:hypothetical protein